MQQLGRTSPSLPVKPNPEPVRCCVQATSARLIRRTHSDARESTIGACPRITMPLFLAIGEKDCIQRRADYNASERASDVGIFLPSRSPSTERLPRVDAGGPCRSREWPLSGQSRVSRPQRSLVKRAVGIPTIGSTDDQQAKAAYLALPVKRSRNG